MICCLTGLVASMGAHCCGRSLPKSLLLSCVVAEAMALAMLAYAHREHIAEAGAVVWQAIGGSANTEPAALICSSK